LEWIILKALFTTILAIVCLILLFFGNLHWQKKIENVGSKTFESVSAKEVSIAEETKETEEVNLESLLSFASQWSEEEKQKLKNAIAENRPYRILLAGSESLGEGETSWPSLLKNEILQTYGENVISIDTKTYTETTEEFFDLSKEREFIEGNYDLILWEPFTLTDNGNVVIETGQEYILSVIKEVKSASPNTSFILQPPNPIYEASFYSVQVRALEKFTSKNNLTFLNHWDAWPKTDSEEIKTFLTEDGNLPNEVGHKTWADFLIGYFISK
jgi:hypothetical protein